MKNQFIMRFVLFFLWMLLPVAGLLGQAKGDLQVTCEPGLRIYVGDQFMGVSKTSEDGLYIEGLPVGRHNVRVEKSGFEPQTISANIVAGRAVEIRVGAMVPAITVEQKGETRAATVIAETGTVIVRSIPISCTVIFRGKTIEKDRDQVDFGNVPSGRNRIVFKRGQQELSHSFALANNQTLELRADFRSGKVIDETAEKAEKAAEEQGRLAEQTGEGLVLVEGGTFMMGSNEGDDDEKPVRRVTVSDFLISKYEVTQALYERVMGSNPSNFKGDANRPVERVTWYDAVNFCNALSRLEGLTPAYRISGNSVTWIESANGYRLPTEAEWEYAARGGNQSRGFKFSGSDKEGEVAWYDGNSGNKTHSVGQKKPNELGLYDMSGNVWEWCWDWYDSGYYGKSPSTDPKGPSSGSFRVLRGGSWNYLTSLLRSANRNRNVPVSWGPYIGFRFSRTL